MNEYILTYTQMKQSIYTGRTFTARDNSVFKKSIINFSSAILVKLQAAPPVIIVLDEYV